MSPPQILDGQWVYTASAGVLLHADGSVLRVLHLSAKIDPAIFPRSRMVLNDAGMSLVTVTPATLCETGRQLREKIDQARAALREAKSTGKSVAEIAEKRINKW